MNIAFISLGTNLGDRIVNIDNAYIEIERRIGKIKKKSSYYKTPPWGFDSTQDFVNSVIQIESELNLFDLLKELQLLEKETGRKKKKEGEGYQDRLIDLDIIDFNNEVFESKEITIPHERMHLRNFVLFPLWEISPNWVHPKLKKSIKFLKNNAPNEPFIEKLN